MSKRVLLLERCRGIKFHIEGNGIKCVINSCEKVNYLLEFYKYDELKAFKVKSHTVYSDKFIISFTDSFNSYNNFGTFTLGEWIKKNKLEHYFLK